MGGQCERRPGGHPGKLRVAEQTSRAPREAPLYPSGVRSQPLPAPALGPPSVCAPLGPSLTFPIAPAWCVHVSQTCAPGCSCPARLLSSEARGTCSLVPSAPSLDSPSCLDLSHFLPFPPTVHPPWEAQCPQASVVSWVPLGPGVVHMCLCGPKGEWASALISGPVS